MSVKTISLLVITGLYFWAAQYRYTCGIKKVCNGQDPTSAESEDSAYPEEFGPLTFKYNDPNAYTSPVNFTAFKENILKGKSEDNILEITGLYFDGETAPEGHENLGLARANSVRTLFTGDIPEESIRLLSKEVEPFENAQTDPFKGVEFKWIEVKVEEAEVIQLADRAVMLFPVGSTGMVRDPAINKYFDDLAANIKITGEKILLTGHTDNTGSEESNLTLGMGRAQAIRDILISKGIDKNIITVESKGESDPVTTNETEAGKHQNRRVELRLIKQ